MEKLLNRNSMRYFVKAPWWLKKLYPDCIWKIDTNEKILYLSFDDGPHEEATPFVLDLLAHYQAKASFFCIGKNVQAHPDIYQRILAEGHRVGNHSYSHLNGWKVSTEEYIQDIIKAKNYIDSNLFRPPYGRINRFQRKLLGKANAKEQPMFHIIMWDVLSGDFDMALTAEQCTKNVIRHAGPGSIITFHDSKKALPRMKESLEKSLDYFSEKGFRFEILPV